MSVLVTGGFGMLGAATVRELIQMGQEVVVLDRIEYRQRLADLDGAYRVEIADLVQPETGYEVVIRNGVDRVCHLAASEFTSSASKPIGAYRDNVTATVQLFAAAAAADVRRFVFISSKAVYPPPSGPYAAPRYEPVPEDAPVKPNSLYGATKLAAELMVEQYSDATGVPSAVLRFGTTYGPGKSSEKYGLFANISRIIEATVAGEPLQIEDTGERTDCVYVDDIGRGIALAVVSDREGCEPYNIATGVGVSLGEVLAVAESVSGNRSVELVAAKQDAGSSLRNMVLDVRKAEEHLGFRARVTLEEAVRAYLRSAS